MTSSIHPDLELLFADLFNGHGPALDHARECELCAAILEEHRQLEKDLFRLADPLPPVDLVQNVMAKVAVTPQPVRLGAKTGIGILLMTVLFAVGAFVFNGGGAGRVGVGLAGAAVYVREAVIALVTSVNAVWHTAAVPAAIALSVILLVSLFGLRRLTDLPLSEQKVLS